MCRYLFYDPSHPEISPSYTHKLFPFLFKKRSPKLRCCSLLLLRNLPPLKRRCCGINFLFPSSFRPHFFTQPPVQNGRKRKRENFPTVNFPHFFPSRLTAREILKRGKIGASLGEGGLDFRFIKRKREY